MKKTLLSLIFISSIFVANAQTAGTLTVTATISSAPYITAVWINNSTPTFIRTLTCYSGTGYISDLVKWTADCGGTRNTVNAVTGATKNSTGVITSTWNAKDKTNTTVLPDGTYTVKIEMTTENYSTSSKLATVSFTKGPTAQTVTGTSVTSISGISLSWVPVNTAIQNVELEKLYSVYPNPAISTIYVSGSDIQEVEICSLSGRSLIVSKEQNVNVSALPKGAYLAVIRAKNGTVVKKIQKI
jgi:hypothetical protein